MLLRCAVFPRPLALALARAPHAWLLVALVTHMCALVWSLQAAERAVKAGSVNYNGVRLKLSRPHGGGSGTSSAPTNVVRLSGVPLATTEESLAKLLAKHGARASAANMQQGPDGAFNGVVLCRYCSNDAAARAVSQLSKAVADGKPLKAEYHLPPGAALRAAAAPAPKAGTPPPAPAPSLMKRQPQGNDFRHRLVPALPQSGPPRSNRRSRGYSEDWTSRRSSDTAKSRVRTSACQRACARSHASEPAPPSLTLVPRPTSLPALPQGKLRWVAVAARVRCLPCSPHARFFAAY